VIWLATITLPWIDPSNALISVPSGQHKTIQKFKAFETSALANHEKVEVGIDERQCTKVYFLQLHHRVLNCGVDFQRRHH
jgi:hypothetical protein